MITVRVKKSKWCRGNPDASMLLLRSGTMCCIGFLARTYGLKPKEIRGIGTLESVLTENSAINTLVQAYEKVLSNAYAINDSKDITDKERIVQLRKIGKDMNVKFVFVP